MEKIKFKGRRVPWGYTRDPDDKELIIPNVEQLKHLHWAYDAFAHKHRPIREVHREYASKAEAPMSMQGLYLRIKKLSSERNNSHIPGSRAPLLATSDPALRRTKKKVASSNEEALTVAKKRLQRIRMTEAWAQRKVDALQKTEKVLAGKGAVLEEEEIHHLPPTVAAHVKDPEKVIFRPNPGPQTDFLASTEQEVFYGGAKGGGKTYALLVDPVRYVTYPASRALILRRTMPELRDVIYKSQLLYPKTFPGAKWRDQDKEWRFPSGARIEFGYADNMADAMRYHGQSYSWVGVDELPQFATPEIWDLLRSTLRSADPNLPTFMRACVDEGDVLTASGWKDIRKVRAGDFVHGLSPSGQLVLRRVTETFAYDIDEPLVRVRKKNLYMSMTADHRVVYRKFGKDRFDIIRWNEHNDRCIEVARTSTSYDAPGYDPRLMAFDPDSYAEFLGIYIAEGCAMRRNYHRRVVVTQNKAINHDFVRRVMEASGCRVCYSANGDFEIVNKELHAHVAPLGKAGQKHFPRAFLDQANQHQLSLALNAYARGDGHWQSPRSVELYTTSRQLVDDLQEICLKLGYKSQFSKKEHTNPNWADSYVVSVTLRGPTTKVDKTLDARNDTSNEPYTGKVYCLAVDEIQNFVIRQNNCVWVSGNTGNPGNVGSGWIKEMFIDPAPANTPFKIKVDINTPSGPIVEYITRRYVPAKVYDNPYLMHDNTYITMLASLPETQRKQLLEGDWDAFDGAAFSEFRKDIHTCAPFAIPSSWVKFRAGDWGYSSPACVLWFAVDYDNNLYVYREYYGKGLTAPAFAQKILEMEAGESIRYGVLDPSTWAKRGDPGPSIAEHIIRAGCHWRPAERTTSDSNPRSRIHSKLEIHDRLKVNEDTGKPRLTIFNNCVNLIRTLPTLPIDKNDPEDVDTRAEDHAYDALRYGCSSRPMNLHRTWESSNSVRTYATSEHVVDEVFGH